MINHYHRFGKFNLQLAIYMFTCGHVLVLPLHFHWQRGLTKWVSGFTKGYGEETSEKCYWMYPNVEISGIYLRPR